MKRLVLATLAVGCFVLTTLSGYSEKKGQPGWELTWEYRFDTPRGADSSVWSKIPRATSDWNNYMTHDNSCYDLRDGCLVLRGIANKHLPDDKVPYLTGGIYTKGKKVFSYGRIEVCAKTNDVQGAWPAIWMLPATAQWPTGGEIDIMERLSHDTFVYQTVHSQYTQKPLNKNNPPHSTTAPIKPGAFNVYAVEIWPDSLSFYVNNKHTFTYPRLKDGPKEQYPFGNEPFYLLIDMQLEGSWVGKVKDEELPAEMEVQWVKFYEWKE